MALDLLFHLEGDDHEKRLIHASNEAAARESCAEGFNSQYGDCDCENDQHDNDDCTRADYTGDEFTLLGVYRTADGSDLDYFDDDTDPADIDGLVAVSTWPEK